MLSALSAGYGREPVVSGISASVALGEVVSVIGPNGAGKSTMLKAVAGFIPVMAGTVTLDGEDVTNLRAHRLARRGLGYVPQTEDVFEGMSVLENLEMGGYLLPRGVLRAAWRRSWPPFQLWGECSGVLQPSSAAESGRCSRSGGS
jgi:branched-chain amino acid transport system ATP-binding protein